MTFTYTIGQDTTVHNTTESEDLIIEHAKQICKQRQQSKPSHTTELDAITEEYLDDLAKRLQADTFSEDAEYNYYEAWALHTKQVELAAIISPSDDDATEWIQICDGRIRSLEGLMRNLANYGQNLTDEINRAVVTEEISGLELKALKDKRAKLRTKYANYQNRRQVLLKEVRPEIERRAGFTIGEYKSAEQLEHERKTKQYRPKKKPMAKAEWDKMDNIQKRQAIRTHFVQIS
tara:strand:+ start:6513 stop:7214 length:702 start_codon:yes stop_codon:yes gene_type:complete